MDISAANLREINSLNQRGGRMLSIVDLIEDGTLDIPLAGHLLARVAEGASFLCAAGPGGVGKTTLMACLLSFLPPEESIRTVTDPWVVGPPERPTCYLCHEIGAGYWYGYLWGEAAARFLALHRQGRIAASLHADSVAEVEEQLLGPSVGADPADLAAVDMLLFMVRIGSMRRVSAVFESAGGTSPSFYRIAEWDPTRDRFRLRPRQRPRDFELAQELMAALVAKGVHLLEEVMIEVAEFYG